MSTNRLHLDFSLETAAERKEFLDTYLQRNEFISKPLTSDELEMCGNYLLWGKDENSLNAVQRKEVQIKTRYGTWDTKEDDSLEFLLENPAFNEGTILGLTHTPLKNGREVFSRTNTLLNAPPSLIPIFNELFTQIDTVDLILNYYDLAHNKRKNPPRQELLNRFTTEQQEELKEEASHLNQYKYLKMRHLLVELRRQQFTLKDSYSSTIQRHTPVVFELPIEPPSFETDIEILPLGVNSDNQISTLIFRDEYIPETYTEKDLEVISNYIWEKEKKVNNRFIVDFRNPEHVYNLFSLYFELEDETFKKNIESQTAALLRTLKFYAAAANLSEIQKEILDLKVHKVKNQDIADRINKKYGKTYTANYISTIFRQKIIKQINAAAAFHLEIINNLFFPENFKKCTCCQKTLLKDSNNFVKKTRSKDGYSNRCKKCDKEERNRKKEV